MDKFVSSLMAEKISEATIRSFGLDASEVVNVLDKCAKECALLIGDEYRLELCRRISEAKITELCDRVGCDLEFFQVWSELEDLGYSNLEREATMLTLVIVYLSKNSTERIPEVENRLEKLLHLFDDEMSNRYRKVLARILRTNKRK